MKPKLIGISGGSASGKTTLARKLAEYFSENTQILSLDNYYKSFHPDQEGSYQHINFDSPDSFDLDLFCKQLKSLHEGGHIAVPQYDFVSHSRLSETKTLAPSKFIIVEGLFLFNQTNCNNEFDFTIYVDAPDDIRLIRRIKRDIKDRGRSVDSVVQQYTQTVRPMHVANVVPNKKLADYVFDGNGKFETEFEKLITCLLSWLN